MLEGIGVGILVALLMQFRPFRWAVYALLLWGGGLWLQDRRSEHRLPDGTPALRWTVEESAMQPVFSEGNPSWRLSLRIENLGAELIQEATLVGTLYECAAPDVPLAACTPVDRSRDFLALDLPSGFVHHHRLYPAFHHAGGPNPRVVWRITAIVADRDAD